MSDTTKTKSKRQKVDKYNGFKVSPRTRKSTKWAIYLYDMIKEAKPELLLNEQVKVAYNALVECLLKFDNSVETWLPLKSYKYHTGSSGIILKQVEYSELMGIPGRWLYTWEQRKDPIIKEQEKKDSKEIIDTYTVLYDLIKRDVVPYMELKQHEITSKQDIEYYHTMMEKLERNIKLFEQSIIDCQKQLNEYAQKALKAQEPPVFTTFN